MIQPLQFLESLKKRGVEFFTGVPDSLLKGFLASIPINDKEHIITANEGAAVAFASGYHLATGKTAMVYLQNSGLGNIINPLTSLADKEVYRIPMLLLIGWRGQPGKKDEPQHKKMGAITQALLQTLGITQYTLSLDSGDTWQEKLSAAIIETNQTKQPVALVVEDGFFGDQSFPNENQYPLSAEDVIRSIYPLWNKEDVIVCNTGKTGRLFYSINKEEGGRIKKYFMNVGSMGHASSIATALALFSNRNVVLLDGDGSLLMHMGSLAVNTPVTGNNFSYILLNNGTHQSVGGQPTAGFHVDFCTIAKGCGFKKTGLVTTEVQLKDWINNYKNEKNFTEIRINNQVRENLLRPAEDFGSAKNSFMQELQAASWNRK